MWAHEEGGQSEHKAIERGEFRDALSGAIADQELMLEQQRLRSDPADATRAEELREGDEQVNRQDEQITHEPNVITLANLRKSTSQGLFRLEFVNSPPTGLVLIKEKWKAPEMEAFRAN